MDTTAHVTISTEQKIKNLLVSLDSLTGVLRREGRYASASLTQASYVTLAAAEKHLCIQTPGHD